MSHLVPCAGCHRHVRDDDGRCPFCAALVTGSGATPPARASRARQYAMGAALATTVMACARTVTPTVQIQADEGGAAIQPLPAPPDAAASATADATPPAPEAGATQVQPPDDRHFHQHRCVTSGGHTICPPYGGAFPDDVFV